MVQNIIGTLKYINCGARRYIICQLIFYNFLIGKIIELFSDVYPFKYLSVRKFLKV